MSDIQLMKAIAVRPSPKGSETPNTNSVHLTTLEMPVLKTATDVLVKVLKVGVDATDREINEGKYGQPPANSSILVIGHEVFGIVQAVGTGVTKVKPGDYVSCTVRRPGPTLFDLIGRNDITSHEEYYERGINLRNGYMTEYFVDDMEFIVRIPKALKHLGVLAEPVSVVAKGIEQALLAQQRLQVWEPKIAYVLGAGQIGLLATLMLRLKGLQVFTFASGSAKDNLKADIATGYGATYCGAKDGHSMKSQNEKLGRGPDLIFEATGSAKLAFEAMEYLGLNGALVWSSVTGGKVELEQVPANTINLQWVLGNKLLVGTVNGNWRHFEQGIAALALGEMMYPGVTQKILTHPIKGLENFREMMDLLETGKCLKVFVEVADE